MSDYLFTDAEIEWLRTAPANVFLYVTTRTSDLHLWHVTTWLGTDIATEVLIGGKCHTGGIAGRNSFKRSVDCRIFGVRYVGWFYESAGDYCRLRKAKRQ